MATSNARSRPTYSGSFSPAKDNIVGKLFPIIFHAKKSKRKILARWRYMQNGTAQDSSQLSTVVDVLAE